MDFKFKKIASVLVILNHLFVSIAIPLYSSAVRANSDMLALSETMAELNAGISTLPDRLTLEPAPATTAQESSDPSPSALNLSAPLFPASPAYDASSSSGPFNTAAELNKEGSNDLISQLPSLEGSQSSLSEEKSLLLNEDMQRSREADENDLRPLEGVKQFWQIMGADSRSQAGMGVITGIANDMASSALRDWMGQSGNTRIQFNSAGEASADLLIPWWDTPSTLLFNQQGVRVNKERTTLNLGLGLRHYLSDHFMLGVNSFYDRDITGNNARFSVGAEAWTHYLKLSANKYQRLTDWHQSPLDAMEDYDERPANGFDLAADAWLPFYPQFGASVKYEKYFGKGIVLDNSASPSDLRDSPSAVTTTVNYTPIPLLTFKAGHKSGSGSDSFVGLDINYRLGLSWQEQTDRETVKVMRSLPGARYDFVDRNYNIVMQYRKQNLISLSLPASVSAEAASTTVITASVRAKYGLKKIDWRAAELIAAGGSLSQDSATSVAVKLPKYLHEGVNSYTVSAIATDNHGNVSPESTVVINLIPSSTIITLEVKPADNVVANGVDAAQLHAKVTGKSGELLSDHNVRFVVSGIDDSCILKGANNCEALHITDTSGSAMVPLASTRAGKVTIFSHLDNGNRDSKTLNFIADSTTAEMADLTIDVNNAVANGNVANKARVLVADYYGNPIGNVPVTFSVAGNATPSTTATVTDSNGSATVELTSKLAGTVTLTASATGMTKSAELTFVADLRTAKIDDLFATPATELTANGADATVLTAVVKDTNGNRVSGAPVIFNATGGAKLGQTTVISDADGAVRVNLTSTRAGSSTVTATTGEDKTGKQVTVTFISDISTAQIGQFTASPEAGLKADGTEAAQLNAVVQDAQGNAVSGILVNFAIISGNGRLSATEAISGNDGTVAVSLTSATANSITVSATTPFDATGQQVSVEFVADVATASVVNLDASPATEVKANGIATSILSALVKDARGNLVRGAKVSFNVPADGNSKLSQPSAITSSEGIATVQLTSTLADIITVTAKTDFDTTGKQATVSFIADATTAKVASLNASRETEVKADGSDSSQLTARVTDNFGNAVAGVTVTFRVQGNAILGESTAETTSDGTATVSLTSKAAGSSTVTAVLDGDSIGKQAVVSFIGDAATAKVESLIPSRDNDVLSNGNDISVLTVTIKDANGNLVNNAKVSFNVSGKGSVTPSPATTTNGIATVQLTSTEAGIVTVTATTDTDATGKQTSVTFMADVGTAKIDSLHASRDSDVKANGTDSSELTVTVRDAYGNLVDGAKVFFSATGKGQLSPTPATTVNGVATTVLTSLGAESISVTATTNVDSTGKTESVSFIADPSTAKLESLTPFPPTALANGSSVITLTTVVTDANSNPVNGVPVSFTATDGAILKSDSATTDSDGKVSVELTSVNAGGSTVTATTDTDQSGQQATVTFVAEAETASIASFTATPSSAVKADGKAISTLTATVKDANGNGVNNELVSFSITGSAHLSASSARTDSNGNATVTLTSTTADSNTITAVTAYDTSGKQISVSFIADVTTANIDSLTASRADNVKADGSDSSVITATVKDANGNLTNGAKVTFSVTDNGILSQNIATTVEGIATVQLTSLTAESITVTATTDADATGKQTSVSFVGDPTTAIVDTLTASPTSGVVANGIDYSVLTATVKDINGNLVSGAKVWFERTPGDSDLSKASVNSVDGLASVQLTGRTAKTIEAIAYTDADPVGKEVYVSFIADSTTVKIDTLTASRYSDVTADGSDHSEISATVKDANGNPLSGVAVSFAVTSGEGVLAKTTISNVKGVATANLTSRSASSSTVTATIEGDNIGQQQVSVSFVADAATAHVDFLDASRKSDIIANGADSSVLRARVLDANNNAVSNKPVSFTISGNANLTGSSATTDNEGYAEIILTSLTADSSTITATTDYDKTGKQASVSFIADQATAKVDSLIAAPESGVTASGKDKSVLTATVSDANGNRVNNARVTFTIEGNASLSTSSATTDSDGKAMAIATSWLAGSNTVLAQTAYDETGKEASVSFIGDAATATIDSFTASTSEAVADGKSFATLTGIVKDANGNLVEGAAVTFKAPATGTLSQSSAVSDSEGKVVITIATEIAGIHETKASTKYGPEGKNAAVSFIADKKTAKVTDIMMSANIPLANGKDQSVLTAVVQDANDNPVSDVDVTFTLNGKATPNHLTAGTDSSGYATITLTSTVAGSNTVTANTESVKDSKSITVEFDADASTATIASLTATPAEGVLADGIAVSTITALITDAYDNPVTDAVVTFSAPGTLSKGQVQTDSAGLAVTTVSSTQAMTMEVMASTNAVDKTVEVTFIGDSKTAFVDSVTASPATGIAIDFRSEVTVKVTAVVKDANGNPVKGVKITFKSSPGDVGMAWGTTTDAKGKSTATIASSVAGSKTITATIDNDPTGKSTNVIFVADSINASKSFLQLSNNSILPADGKSTLTITLIAKDQFKNKATSAKVAFKVANLDGAKISAVTEEDGVYTATLTSGTKAATGTITVLENDTLLEGLSAEVGQYSSQVTLVIN